MEDIAGLGAFILLAGIYLFFAAQANSDLTAGRFILSMDERLTFDGVRNILHPHDLRSWAYAVINGGDQRYGRSLWNLSAFASFLPDRIWGDPALIIVDRMTQAIFLLGADILFCLTFARGWLYRLLLLFVLLAMPYASYYATLPKPEPLQLLFLAIFLSLHQRRGFSFGPHWLVLGLAFGTKISTLPAVLVFALAAAYQEAKPRGRGVTLDQSIKTGSYFVAGLALAVPTLLVAIIPMLVLYHAWRSSRWAVNGVAVKLAVLALAAGAGILLGHTGIRHWVGQTFLNTAHGDDQAGINALSWAGYFLQTWLGPVVLLNVALALVAMLFVLLHLVQDFKDNGWKKIQPGLLLVVVGMILNLSIFVGAHRLWGFYLVPGMSLLLVGLVSLAEYHIARAGSWQKILRPAAAASLFLMLLSAAFWASGDYAEFEGISRRTQDPDYRREFATYQAVTDFLGTYAKSQKKMLDVSYDPILFPPDDNPQYRITEFWGPYTNWDAHPDVIIFAADHTAAGKPYPAGSPEYRAYTAERAGYAQFVIEPGQACRQQQCYERDVRLPDGGEILVRKVQAAKAPLP